MNRNKQIADRARGDGQARILGNLQITARYLSSDYKVLTHDLARGETGLLKVFSLIPNAASEPRFEARVDDGKPGKRREPELDIDIEGVAAATKSDFKAKRMGYSGHHSKRSSNPDQRIFDVEIATPAGRIFEGEVSFSVTFSVGVSLSATSSVSVEAVVIRAK